MTTTPQRTARPRPKRGEGQWALGYTEPLNKNEQTKKDDNPLNVRARVENIYALRGFDSIDKQDLRGRLRWWGLYTQREQGYDGTWTGDENIDVLEAKYFMMRVRCDGGALSTAALRTQRALPFIALSGLALVIPFSRQLRERKRMTDALLRANKAMTSIARLTATGMQPRPTRDVLDELLRLGLEALNGDAGAIYVSDAPDKPLRRAVFIGEGFPRIVERGSYIASAPKEPLRIRE